jgi:hypothetical protein
MPEVYPDVQVQGKLGVGGRCWSPAFGLITPAATSDTRWVSFAAHQPARSPTRLGIGGLLQEPPESIPMRVDPRFLGA